MNPANLHFNVTLPTTSAARILRTMEGFCIALRIAFVDAHRDWQPTVHRRTPCRRSSARKPFETAPDIRSPPYLCMHASNHPSATHRSHTYAATRPPMPFLEVRHAR